MMVRSVHVWISSVCQKTLARTRVIIIRQNQTYKRVAKASQNQRCFRVISECGPHSQKQEPPKHEYGKEDYRNDEQRIENKQETKL